MTIDKKMNLLNKELNEKISLHQNEINENDSVGLDGDQTEENIFHKELLKWIDEKKKELEIGEIIQK